MTLFLSVLSGAIGMGQFHLMGGSNADNEHSMPLIILVVQCIFALIIAAVLFIWTLGLGISRWLHGMKPQSEAEEGSPAEKPNGDEKSLANRIGG